MHTERITITLSAGLLDKLNAVAEQDSPGAPNRSATAVRLLAHALANPRMEKRFHRVLPDRDDPWGEPRWKPVQEVLRGRTEPITITELCLTAGWVDVAEIRAIVAHILRRAGWEGSYAPKLAP